QFYCHKMLLFGRKQLTICLLHLDIYDFRNRVTSYEHRVSTLLLQFDCSVLYLLLLCGNF
ncbi:hypothetical protein HN51_059031, partial [Arachis hypogaea]